jgi:hypothetical protein
VARRRKLGLGPQNPGKGANPARANGKGVSPLFQNTSQGQPPRRRKLGHGPSAYPTPETAAERAERLKNRGVTPGRSRLEEQLLRAPRAPGAPGVLPPRKPTSIDSFGKPSSRSVFAQEEIRQAIDKASANLSLATQQALRRADWWYDDSALLTDRPTNTSNPNRPRTLAAGYDAQSGVLFVRFRGAKLGPRVYADGVGYEYYNVTQTEWDEFRRDASPGTYINHVLNYKPYTPATW